MTHKAYKTIIPRCAIEVITETWEHGGKKSATYFVGPDEVGRRSWYEDGQLDYEIALRRGQRHGNWYQFYPNGQLEEVEPYRNGVAHGVGKQYSPTGKLLITWKLVKGVGLDLWCGLNDSLAEEHHWPRPGERGMSRQWCGDDKTIWQEYYFIPGLGYHGIWREWNDRGKLRRGFPHWYLRDQRVNKREYLQACEHDRLLVPYRAEEDLPSRELPREYVVQKSRRH